MTTLLDADSTTLAVGNGQWTKGWDNADRMCGIHVFLDDYCGSGPHSVVGSTGRSADPYAVRSFAIMAEIDRSLMCSQADDESWLSGTLKDALNQAFTRALCTQHADGSNTWIGDPSVRQMDDILAARMAWFGLNAGTPTLHLSADEAVTAAGAGLLFHDSDDALRTLWGDPVVVGNGYLQATAFWAGPIALYVSTTESTTLFSTLKNGTVVQSNAVGAVDMAPCTVMRVGPTPTQTFPIPAAPPV